MTNDISEDELAAGRGYEALFVPALFQPWTRHSVSAAGIGEGAHVLDVACGTGVLARDCLTHVGDRGRVVGLDPAAGMLAAAREVEPSIEWVQGGAESLPFEDGIFDAVVSQFGMMFFQDRNQAAREMLRVLKPGGALSVVLWHGLDRNQIYEDMVALMSDEIGPEAAQAVSLPFGLGNPDQVEALLVDAGFADVSHASLSEKARFPSTATMVEVELRGWLPLFGIHTGDARIKEIIAASEPRLAKYRNADGAAAFPTSAYVVKANKPI